MGLAENLILVGLVVLQSSSVPAAGGTEQYGAAYFRSVLDKEGPKGITNRLYVAPPDLMTPLFSGITSGSPEWLDIYGGLRDGVASENKNSATIEYLDDALARALGKATAGVLSYLHAHREIPVKLICGRSAPLDGDSATVLDPSQMLALIRRQRRLSGLREAAVKAERSACLAATDEVVRRQLRIYLVSYGADDARSKSQSALAESDRT